MTVKEITVDEYSTDGELCIFRLDEGEEEVYLNNGKIKVDDGIFTTYYTVDKNSDLKSIVNPSLFDVESKIQIDLISELC